jgi:serine protease Do
MPISSSLLSRRVSAAAIVLALVASAAQAQSPATPQSPLVLPSPAIPGAAGPASVADLSERLIDSVVNISTTQTVGGTPSGGEGNATPQPPQLPPGTPFEDFFNEFFKNRKGDGRPRKTSSLGSGFVLDPSGIIVTNNHVIEGADDIEAVFNDGTKLKAKLVGRDKKIDIAVLKVEPTKPLRAVRFGDSDSIRVGDWALAIGNPFGLGGTVTLGIVSARNRDINSGPYDNYIQTDAAINRGNSGGPLFNMLGEVVGINTAIISPTGGSIGIGFSVPATTAGPIVEQLRQYGETRRGWLGVRIQVVTPDIAESLGMDQPKGALIAGIDDKGPAKPAGLEPGDVIIKFDGKSISEMRDLPRIVADTPVDKDVEVIILRKGAEMTRTVRIARLDESEEPQKTKLEQPEPEKAPVAKALGLSMSGMTKDLRDKYKLKEDAKGVVVTEVEGGSVADEKQVKAGDVILQVGQQVVATPEEVTARLDQLKKSGTKQALLLLSNGQGELRFVAIALE